MANVRYLNQQNPFWDFLSSLEANTGNHPFFNAYSPESRNNNESQPQQEGAPPRDANGPENHGPPPHDNPFGPGFPFSGRRGGPHGHRGGWNPRGGRCGGGDRGFGGWPAMDMNKIAEFVSQFIPEEVLAGATKASSSKDNNNNKDFTPAADIFDTEDAYVVHISLPGAKKEDVGVNWDADKSELNIAGVIYRPGDEEFLKTLALDERKVGVFERKVRLGSKSTPAQVDSDGISAKMEDGILMVTIPKLDHDIVEVKKVDIE